eukprot:2793117-Prorocentrum_lima.AAC.1
MDKQVAGRVFDFIADGATSRAHKLLASKGEVPRSEATLTQLNGLVQMPAEPDTERLLRDMYAQKKAVSYTHLTLPTICSV